MAVQRFPSKIDAWLVAVTVIGPAVALVVLWLVVTSGASDAWPGLAIATLSAGAVAWLFTSTYYEIGEGALVARSGPFRFRRPLGSIGRVRATRTWLSAPALSLDRMDVQGSAGSLVISPRDKAAFLRALCAAAPRVELDETLSRLIA